MKMKKVGSVLLSTALALGLVTPVQAAEGEGAGGAAPILQFDFSNFGKADANGNITVTGKANGADIKATAENVVFENDEAGNAVAVFGQGGAVSSIVFAPETGKDPMATLKEGDGVTISAWIKTSEKDFSGTLFYYGADEYVDKLGEGIQILARNDSTEKKGEVVLYRRDNGLTYDQKVKQTDKTPYGQDTWHLVTYVDNGDGTGKFYIDGASNGELKKGKRTLQGFATDDKKDTYYIGIKPDNQEPRENFIGSMDSITIYGSALTEDEVKAEFNNNKPDVVENVKEILNINFDGADEKASSVIGKTADGNDVSFASQNVTYENGHAIFPKGTTQYTTGLSYIADTQNKDPMKALEDGRGVTISAWVKTGEDAFSSTIFAYGGWYNNTKMGNNIQLVGRTDSEQGVVFYRNKEGKSEPLNEYPKLTAKVNNPYEKDTWQMVTYVEKPDGTGKFYIDGNLIGTISATKHSVYDFATDTDDGENLEDRYYIGYLPYVEGGDDDFVGAMDNVIVYDAALTQYQIQTTYENQKQGLLENAKTNLQNAIDAAKKNKNPEDYTEDSWEKFNDVLTKANDAILSADTDNNPDKLEQLQKDLEEAEVGLVTKAQQAKDDAIAALKDAIASANSKKEEDYTSDTWKDFEEKRDTVIKAGEEALNDPKATVEYLNKCTNDINEILELLKANDTYLATLQKELNEAVINAKAKQYTKTDYTEDTWNKYIAALTDAEKELNNAVATADALITCKNNLVAAEDAMAAEKKKALADAIEALTAAVEAAKAKDYKKDNHTTADWEAYIKAFGAAEEALEAIDNAELATIQQLTSNLIEAEQKLVAKELADAREKLDEAVKAAGDKGYVKADYTVETWKKYTDAMTEAEKELKNEDTTAEALIGCKNSLIEAETELLKEALAVAVKASEEKGYKADDYTKENWDGYEQALAAAKEPKADATVEDLEKLISNLDAAEKKLEAEKVLAELAVAVKASEEKGYKADDYTKESWDGYEQALAAAKEPKADATVEDLEKLISNLDAAEKILEAEKALAELAAAVKASEEKGYKADDYTKESWDGYEKALADAKAPKAEATVEEIQKLISDLETAEKNLAPVEQSKDELAEAKAALEAAVKASEAKDYKAEDYTKESWDGYEKALADAKAPNAEATVEEIQKLISDLKTAEENLAPVEQVKDELAEAKAELAAAVKASGEKGYKADDYTKENWAVYEKALAAAKEPKEDATVSDIQKLISDLDAAEKKLEEEKTAAAEKAAKELADAKAALAAAVKAAEAKGYKAEDYTKDSWDAYAKALAAAKAPKKDANIADIQKLTSDLAAAEKKLEAEKTAAAEKAAKELADAKTALDTAVKASEAKGYKAENYTKDSWDGYTAALAAAKAPKADATVADIQKLTSDLDTAEKNLKAVETTVTSTLSEQENKIATMLEVTPEAAKEIAAVVSQYQIPDATLQVTEKFVLALQNDNDVAGSSFALIQARSEKQTKNSVKLKWNKITGADGYIIYGAKCGKKNSYKVLTTVTGTSYTQKKLAKGTYYKYIVCAYKEVAGTKVTLAASKTIHAVTKGGKYGVAKSVKVKPAKVSLKIGKSQKLTAKEIKADKKIRQHRKIKYESSDTKVATVANSGKIKAIGKGKCNVYVYAQNGVYKKVSVVVK